MASSYGSWSLPNLKAELRRRNARLAGRKADLVERLEAYDRNANFGVSDVSQPEYNMELPICAEYKDIHADMPVPRLARTDVTAYLAEREKELDQKAIRLYRDKYINFARASIQPQGTFFKAEVRAEMKTGVCYVVDICVSNNLVIQECQCECAAGMGPYAHCKHVSCVLFGLTDFTQTHSFTTLATCTQQLQTFHQAKKHLGSPVKSEKLKMHVSVGIDFDPRPPQLRNTPNYGDYFQNFLLDSQKFNSAPIMHTLLPANPYAYNVDHDYLQHSPSEQFLRGAGLVDVSEQYLRTIETDTQGSRRLWREERRKRLCSSNFGLVCKLTARTDKAALAKKLVEGRQFRSKATTHGKTYERVAIKKYEEMTNRSTSPCGLVVSKEHPFLASTPDRSVTESLLLEVKCPYTAKDKEVSPQTVPYLSMSDDGILGLKKSHDYYYQVQGQMLCTGAAAKTVDFVVFTLKDVKILQIQRDDLFIEDMIAKLQSFHEDFHKHAVLEKYFFRGYGELF